jgi:anti-sigma factor RsiW
MSSPSDRERFELDHRWAPEQMSPLLDGELAVAARERLARHLSECDECRRVLAGLRALLGALGGLAGSRGEADSIKIARAVRARLQEPRAP